MTKQNIQKYNKRTTESLRDAAIRRFNAAILRRDQGMPCISCGEYKTRLVAGHYYSAGHHTGLRFHADNVHGQCVRCNWHLSGNLIKYRQGLLSKIGQERLDRLDMMSEMKSETRNLRYLYIDVIETFKKQKR